MSTKTSQLQIRVSPGQKAALKRLAERAGMTVSQYVLSTVLPTASVELATRIEALRTGVDRRRTLSDLRLCLSEMDDDDFLRTTADVDVEPLPTVVQNYVAAAIEHEAVGRRLDPPPWASKVKPPDKPHFAWDVRSLRPHLIRITPSPYKRRNLFVDAHGVESS